MPEGLVKSANQILVAGNPLRVEMKVGANATTAKMLPGNVVIFDDVDQTVKEAGDKAHGVVGLLDVAPGNLEATAYAVGDHVMVIIGECIAKARLKAAQNVARGDRLVAAADGQVAKLAVGVMGAQGDVVGEAWESSNVTTLAEILVHWLPAYESAAVS